MCEPFGGPVDWGNRSDVLTAALTAVGVLLATGVMRVFTQGTFAPAWFWVVASAVITWVAPKVRRRLDAQDLPS